MRVSSVLTTVLSVILSLPFAASANDKGVVLVTGANRGLGLEFVKQLLTQALLPNLKAGQRKTIVSITSRLGSIELSTGGLYSYRTSKTALNQINKIISTELAPQGFTCVVMHPGWVRTDMGGANATLAKAESISSMLKVIEHLTIESTGKFFNYDGEELPW